MKKFKKWRLNAVDYFGILLLITAIFLGIFQNLGPYFFEKANTLVIAIKSEFNINHIFGGSGLAVDYPNIMAALTQNVAIPFFGSLDYKIYTAAFFLILFSSSFFHKKYQSKRIEAIINYGELADEKPITDPQLIQDSNINITKLKLITSDNFYFVLLVIFGYFVIFNQPDFFNNELITIITTAALASIIVLIYPILGVSAIWSTPESATYKRNKLEDIATRTYYLGFIFTLFGIMAGMWEMAKAGIVAGTGQGGEISPEKLSELLTITVGKAGAAIATTAMALVLRTVILRCRPDDPDSLQKVLKNLTTQLNDLRIDVSAETFDPVVAALEEIKAKLPTSSSGVRVEITPILERIACAVEVLKTAPADQAAHCCPVLGDILKSIATNLPHPPPVGLIGKLDKIIAALKASAPPVQTPSLAPDRDRDFEDLRQTMEECCNRLNAKSEPAPPDRSAEHTSSHNQMLEILGRIDGKLGNGSFVGNSAAHCNATDAKFTALSSELAALQTNLRGAFSEGLGKVDDALRHCHDEAPKHASANRDAASTLQGLDARLQRVEARQAEPAGVNAPTPPEAPSPHFVVPNLEVDLAPIVTRVNAVEAALANLARKLDGMEANLRSALADGLAKSLAEFRRLFDTYAQDAAYQKAIAAGPNPAPPGMDEPLPSGTRRKQIWPDHTDTSNPPGEDGLDRLRNTIVKSYSLGGRRR